MRSSKILIVITGIFISVFLLFPRGVYAYVDPGTGSYIVQLVAGFIFGGLLGVKIYWKKIKSFFLRLFTKEPHGDQNT